MRGVAVAVLLLTCAACGAPAEGQVPTRMAADSASPVTSSRQAPCPNPRGGSCLGPLAANSYTSRVFQPPISYSVSAGWDNEVDTLGDFLLIPPGGNLRGADDGTSDYVGIYGSVGAPNGCAAEAAPGVAATVTGVTDWITHDPSLLVVAKQTVHVGGLAGVVMDLAVSPLAKPCPYSNGHPVAPFIIGVGRSAVEHNIGPGQKARLYLLDNGGDALAIEVVDVHGGIDLDANSALTETLSFAR